MTPNEYRLAVLNEGKKSKPYRDTVGKITIGIGRNLTDVGLRESEINTLLDNDLETAKDAIRLHLPWATPSFLGEARYAAVVDLVFNMGIRSFLKFRATLNALTNGDWDRAGANLRNSLWFKQVAQRGPRIVNMIVTNKWPWEN